MSEKQIIRVNGGKQRKIVLRNKDSDAIKVFIIVSNYECLGVSCINYRSDRGTVFCSAYSAGHCSEPWRAKKKKMGNGSKHDS